MAAETPTQDEVVEYFDTLSNWGRWGPDDELGTLNLISPNKRLVAIATVRDGVSVGCARPLMFEDRAPDVRYPPQHFMYRTGDAETAISAADFLGVACHGLTVSHVDALSHQFFRGNVYNGRPQRMISSEGASVCAVDVMRDGIVTRGVLLDIPRLQGKPYLEAGDAIYVSDLEAAEEAHGVEVGDGDALLVNTGWYRRRREVGPHPVFRERPGLHASTMPWLHERGVAVLGGDAAQDVVPSGYPDILQPLHSIAVTAMGLCLLDNLQFDDLAAACEERNRWEFLFMVAPLRVRRATGSAVTPLAIF